MNDSRRDFLKTAVLGSGSALCGIPSVASVYSAAEAPQNSGAGSAGSTPSGSTEVQNRSERLSDLVNVLQGTDSSPEFSRGNTLPIVAAPFGMGHWTLQTTSQRSTWFFNPEDRRLEGIRCTHQLAPWLGDYGSATLLPFMGSPNLEAAARASSYRPEELRLTPYSMHLRLMRYGVTVDLVPTERCAAMDLTFAHSGPGGLCIALPGAAGTCVQSSTPGLFLVASPDNRGGVAPGFATYYALVLDVDAARLEVKQFQHENVAAIRFNVNRGQKVRVRIGTSFISHEQATRNLDYELNTQSLDQLRLKTASVWEDQLGRARIVESNQDRRKIFYSALYRASLFPRVWHELDASGTVVHRSPYTGSVLPGVMYADHGFWDVYRAWYPMMTLLYPDRLAEILQAWVNASHEGGWIPQFPCPGYRGAMSGSPSDSVFGDAAVKGIKGFDLEGAYKALRKHATETQKPGPGYGRQGVADYLQYGYLPLEKHGGALTETLDAAYGDFCISQVARVLGHEDDARMFEQRSQNWRRVYDPATRFLRPRLSNGQFPADFVANRWGNGYVEGSAWQYRVSVPHDPEGLIAAMGGPAAYVQALDELTAGPPDFEIGDYGFEIHEMSEMAAVDFGQYAHSNQPSHHILYMYAMAGRPDRTQYWVRRTLTELYTVDSFAGDEDTGSMAAWYVLSALGFYSLCPGRPWYVLGSPLFEEATLHLPYGVQTKIIAQNQAPDRPFVRSCTMNGKPIEGVTIPHKSLSSGGELVFAMQGIKDYRVTLT